MSSSFFRPVVVDYISFIHFINFLTPWLFDTPTNLHGTSRSWYLGHVSRQIGTLIDPTQVRYTDGGNAACGISVISLIIGPNSPISTASDTCAVSPTDVGNVA